MSNLTFLSMKEALKFKETCPYCTKNLEIRSKQHVGKLMGEVVPEIQDDELIFSDLIINLNTDEIIQPQEFALFCGVFFKNIRLDCMSCWQWYHTIQISADTVLKKLTANITSIGIKRIIGDYEYSLKTSLAYDESKLTKAPLYREPFPDIENNCNWNVEHILPVEMIFPFVEINLENPDETIIKLDNLKIYS